MTEGTRCTCGAGHQTFGACRDKECPRCGSVQPICTMRHKRAYCASCARDYHREWRHRTGYARRRQYGRRLSDKGITEERHDAMLAAQGGGCALCFTSVPGQYGWQIDHDHDCCPGQRSCGECVRGLLCFHCNVALGLLKDDPDLLRRAADFIEVNRARRRQAV